MKQIILSLAVLAALAFGAPVTAQNYDEDLVAPATTADFAAALERIVANERMLLAERGDAEAQTKFGLKYYNGDGVPHDYAEAARWFGLAAEQGVASAQYNLGLMYSNGHGVEQDFESAHIWFNIASANGDTEAGTLRDDLAAQVSPDQIAKAQARARVCMASGYQDCE